jgi:hypothetical protein
MAQAIGTSLSLERPRSFLWGIYGRQNDNDTVFCEFSLSISFHRDSIAHSYIMWGMNNSPSVAAVQRGKSHPIDMNKDKVYVNGRSSYLILKGSCEVTAVNSLNLSSTLLYSQDRMRPLPRDRYDGLELSILPPRTSVTHINLARSLTCCDNVLDCLLMSSCDIEFSIIFNSFLSDFLSALVSIALSSALQTTR